MIIIIIIAKIYDIKISINMISNYLNNLKVNINRSIIFKCHKL